MVMVIMTEEEEEEETVMRTAVTVSLSLFQRNFKMMRGNNSKENIEVKSINPTFLRLKRKKATFTVSVPQFLGYIFNQLQYSPLQIWSESTQCVLHIYENMELEEKLLEKVLKLSSFDF